MERSNFLQLEPGLLEPSTLAYACGGFTVARHDFNVGFRLQAQLLPGKVLIGLSAAEEPDARWFGKSIGSESLGITGGPIELSATGSSTFYAITVDLRSRRPYVGPSYRRLAALASTRASCMGNAPGVSYALRSQLTQLFNRPSEPQKAIEATLWRTVERVVLPIVSKALAGEYLAEAAPAVARRVDAVRRCEAYVRDNVGTDITLAELSAVSRLRLRSLINAFQAVTGLSPMAYLKRQRLNEVRRALRRGRAGTRIIDVAANWGFWHMGHFTTDYRVLFGELPSQTLGRARTRLQAKLGAKPTLDGLHFSVKLA